MRTRTLILLMASGVHATPGPPTLSEYELLAKVIPIVLSLVSWPGGEAHRPLKVAILGGVELGVWLDRGVANRTVGGRTVALSYTSLSRYLKDVAAYDVVFIDRGEEAGIDAILSLLQRRPVLTLGYANGLAQRGVMMNFYLDGGRIRFEANPQAIKSAGLSVNSHLMNMAKIVGTGS